jgi:hypothetical protein
MDLFLSGRMDLSYVSRGHCQSRLQSTTPSPFKVRLRILFTATAHAHAHACSHARRQSIVTMSILYPNNNSMHDDDEVVEVGFINAHYSFLTVNIDCTMAPPPTRSQFSALLLCTYIVPSGISYPRFPFMDCFFLLEVVYILLNTKNNNSNNSIRYEPKTKKNNERWKIIADRTQQQKGFSSEELWKPKKDATATTIPSAATCDIVVGLHGGGGRQRRRRRRRQPRRQQEQHQRRPLEAGSLGRVLGAGSFGLHTEPGAAAAAAAPTKQQQQQSSRGTAHAVPSSRNRQCCRR